MRRKKDVFFCSNKGKGQTETIERQNNIGRSEVNGTFQVDTKQKPHWKTCKNKRVCSFLAVIDAWLWNWKMNYFPHCTLQHIKWKLYKDPRYAEHLSVCLTLLLRSGDIKVNGPLFTWLKLNASLSLQLLDNKSLFWRSPGEMQSRYFQPDVFPEH